jgi:hypothetical protein
MKPFFFLF